MKSFIQEFKTFAIKGNMLDLAVGVIIGGVFGSLVSSLVDDILTPLIAGIFGSPDFSNLFFILRKPIESGIDLSSLEAVRQAGGVALGYGLFLNNLISFLIVAFVLFLFIKGINKIRHASSFAEEKKETPPSAELETLQDIKRILEKHYH